MNNDNMFAIVGIVAIVAVVVLISLVMGKVSPSASDNVMVMDSNLAGNARLMPVSDFQVIPVSNSRDVYAAGVACVPACSDKEVCSLGGVCFSKESIKKAEDALK